MFCYNLLTKQFYSNIHLKPKHGLHHAILQECRERREIFCESSLFLWRYEELSKVMPLDHFIPHCTTSTGGRKEQAVSRHSASPHTFFPMQWSVPIIINQQNMREGHGAMHNLLQDKDMPKQCSSVWVYWYLSVVVVSNLPVTFLKCIVCFTEKLHLSPNVINRNLKHNPIYRN